MTGGRLKSFRMGDRSELLIEYLLSGLAFTTRVPRQEDVGVDFLCSLINEDENRLLRAGPVFVVQAKSSCTEIVYEKPHELDWIINQENPFFICVADRNQSAMDMYSTWNLHKALLADVPGGALRRIVLRPGKESDEVVIGHPDGTQEVPLGRPIVHVAHSDIMSDDRARHLAGVVRGWVLLDRGNIVRRFQGLNYILGPRVYETDVPPHSEFELSLHCSPSNLGKSTRNFAEAAVGLWRVLHHPAVAAKVDMTANGVQILEQVLRWVLPGHPSLKAFAPEIEAGSSMQPTNSSRGM